MSRKALRSVLFHKSEVTYRDTGVSKNCTHFNSLLKICTYNSIISFKVLF